MIGEEVRSRREALGLTGAQLATRAGLAPSAVSQIETGKRTPSSTSVIKLAAALGVEVGDLYPKGQAPLPDFASEQRREPKTHTSGANLQGTGTLDVGQDLVLIGEERRKSIEEQVLAKILERTERGELSAEEAMDEVREKAEIRQ